MFNHVNTFIIMIISLKHEIQMGMSIIKSFMKIHTTVSCILYMRYVLTNLTPDACTQKGAKIEQIIMAHYNNVGNILLYNSIN